MRPESLVAMQEGRARRPVRCRFGLHDFRETQWLFTTGTAHCSRCGEGLLLSIWGAFPMDRADAIKSLRNAAIAIEAAAADKTGTGLAEGESAGRQASPNAKGGPDHNREEG